MAYFERNGNDLHYQVWECPGSTRWVTLLNGYTRPLNDFGPLAKQLVAQGFQVLSLDNRGAGQTHFQGTFSIDDMAEDVAALWKHLGITRSALMGISMGGVIAATLTARHGPSVEKLVIVSAPIERSYLQTAKDHASLSPAERAQVFERYFSANYIEKNRLFVTGFIRQMDRFFQDARIIRGARAQRAATEHFDLVPLVTSIQVETLVLHGEEDNVVSIQSGEKFQKLLPKSRLVRFPEAGHLLLVEKPKQLSSELINFLK